MQRPIREMPTVHGIAPNKHDEEIPEEEYSACMRNARRNVDPRRFPAHCCVVTHNQPTSTPLQKTCGRQNSNSDTPLAVIPQHRCTCTTTGSYLLQIPKTDHANSQMGGPRQPRTARSSKMGLELSTWYKYAVQSRSCTPREITHAAITSNIKTTS